MSRVSAAFAALALLGLSGCDSSGGGGSGGGSGARDQIRAVGSSTVYPFATAVAEQFVNKNAGMKSPIVESTGTGAGFKLFCGGIGARHPDIATASRAIKKSEYESCVKNKVSEIVEIQIGLDGIAFAEGKTGDKLALTPRDIYAALAANPFGKAQTAKTWRDVNPALPAVTIKVYGPPSTSGTRDALAELILTKGCDTDAAMKALKVSDSDAHKKTCTTIREDGAFVDAGENDNLIVQKLLADPKALGIFGYSFLEENTETLNGNTINGIAPTYATISDYSYPGARPLFIYIKSAHLKAIKGLKEFVSEFASAWGPDGYLKKRGMVVAPADVRASAEANVRDMKPLDPANLK
jgi:phosphate transport system substrate-binding protein